MNSILESGFSEMKNEELEAIDGGFAWIGVIIAVGLLTQIKGCSSN